MTAFNLLLSIDLAALVVLVVLVEADISVEESDVVFTFI